MKRYITLAVLCLAAATVSAQTLDEALNYCDQNYYGTARSAALGNAMTAVGGDLGSVGINPAGAAVAGYSQFTLTPGLSICSTQSNYSPVIGEKVQTTTPESQTRFIVPNFGFMMNVDTRRGYGLKNWTFGMTINTTNVFNERMSAGGVNDNSTMLGELAYYTVGVPYYDLLYDNDSGYDPYDHFGSGFWPNILAYQSYMTSDHEDDDNYVGSSEVIFDDGSIDLGGKVNQSYFRQRTGSKSDAVINLAFNWDDRFYLGGNIGVVSMNFTENINRKEKAVNPSEFPLTIEGADTYWIAARERYSLETEGTGIYAKLGFIWLPLEGLRLGGAIQTPTLYTITERWKWDGICQFDPTLPEQKDLYETPVGEYTYQLLSPFSFNLGVAYTLGDRALLSADWERTAYRSMRFRDYQPDSGVDSFGEDNGYIRRYAGVTNNLRLGAEYRVNPAFALRAGYSYKNYAEKVARPDYDQRTSRTTHVASLGFGYSSPGSFFMDCAVRYAMAPNEWYYPYNSYEVLNKGNLVWVDPPEIGISRRLMDVVLTLGWRF